MMIKKSKSWQLQEAKNKLSEVANRAIQEGPQLVTRFGEPEFYIVSCDHFEKINSKKDGFLDLIINSPFRDIPLDSDRPWDKKRKTF